jgi:hypothetical protein
MIPACCSLHFEGDNLQKAFDSTLEQSLPVIVSCSRPEPKQPVQVCRVITMTRMTGIDCLKRSSALQPARNNQP